jgi:hypothetical protein
MSPHLVTIPAETASETREARFADVDPELSTELTPQQISDLLDGNWRRVRRIRTQWWEIRLHRRLAHYRARRGY